MNVDLSHELVGPNHIPTNKYFSLYKEENIMNNKSLYKL